MSVGAAEDLSDPDQSCATLAIVWKSSSRFLRGRRTKDSYDKYNFCFCARTACSNQSISVVTRNRQREDSNAIDIQPPRTLFIQGRSCPHSYARAILSCARQRACEPVCGSAASVGTKVGSWNGSFGPETAAGSQES
eukprot:2598875-Rhodomonas_salina.2